MKKAYRTLHFPLAGVQRRFGYEYQPPYSTPSAQNVRPRETYERRARGGSRGGLKVGVAAHTDMDGLTRWCGTVGWVDGTTRKEALVVIGGGRSGAVGRDLFYSLNGTSFLTVTNAVVAGTDQIFATEKLQKLYIADPGASGDAQVRVWDPSSPSTVANNTTTSGTMPDDCPLIGMWHDRIVIAGPDQNYYMSRLCTPTDWSYGCDIDDPGRASAGTSSDAARLGEPITALAALTRNHLLFGCTNSLWALRGDPTYGGQFDPVSRQIGIVSGAAWCQDPEGTFYFLSRDGLYSLDPGGDTTPKSLSRDKIPDSLRGIDASANYVSVGYSIEEHGIYVSRTPTSGLGEHWFYDLLGKGFWLDVYPTNVQPACYTLYAKDQSAQRQLYFGGRGGYICRIDEDTTTDQDGAGTTAAISSHVQLGPIRLGDGYHDGSLREIGANLDEGSGNVSWDLLVGSTAEEASQASSFMGGTWVAGRNYQEHPRARGSAAIVKVSGTGRWAIEDVLTVSATLGRARGV